MANNTINTTNPSIDLTVQIFDNFYRYRESISAVEYDVVYSYFRSVFTTEQQAKNFAATLFRISNASGISAQELLQQVQAQGSDLPQITLTFAYYLNTLQSSATMLGIKAPTTPNFYVARNIRQ
jgi:hypothetical protein